MLRRLSPKRRKQLLVLLASFCALVGLFVFFLPTILGSKWIYEPLVARLRANDFEVTIDKVELSWLSPLSIRGIRMKQQTGPTLLEIESIRGNRGILGYLLGGRSLGRLEINHPVVAIELIENGSNLQRFVDAIKNDSQSKEATAKKTNIGIDLDVAVVGASATVAKAGNTDPIAFIPPFDLQLNYRALHQAASLDIQPTTVLDHVQLTPELVRLGLEFGIPLLANSTKFEGRISLALGESHISLSDPLASKASAKITLHEVRSGPSQPAIIDVIDLLAKWRQTEIPHELVFVNGSEIQVELADGKVTHEGLRTGLPTLDERLQIATSGSVGIKDRSLDLLIEIPVPLEQLARRDSVKALGVPKLKLPLTGTLDEPQIDWKEMRTDAASVLGLIKESLDGQAPKTEKVIGLLEGLADGRADDAVSVISGIAKVIEQQREQRKQANAPSANSDAEAENESAAPSKPARPFRDALKGLLNKSEREKDN